MEVLIIFGFAFVLYIAFKSRKRKVIVAPIGEDDRKFLEEKIEFYRELNNESKRLFENRIHHFLSTTNIIGVNTNIDIRDKLLVASSAIIPVFEFPEWEYRNLYEVLIYPTAFDENFSISGSEKRIQGMVGTGTLEGKMILSKSALHAGFNNDADKKNVGIHEFIHLIDKADGQIDGIPSLLLNKQYTIPWLAHIKSEIEAIHALDSDINAYGGVSVEEFFPVISEYFFERPKLLENKHPELYKMLQDIFTVDLAKKYKGIKKNSETGRNDPCPCGSGKKFKHCCLANR